MRYSLEELQSYQQKGILESYLQGHGLLPLKVLEDVLEQQISTDSKLLSKELEIEELTMENGDLKDALKNVTSQLDNALSKVDDLLKVIKVLEELGK